MQTAFKVTTQILRNSDKDRQTSTIISRAHKKAGIWQNETNKEGRLIYNNVGIMHVVIKRLKLNQLFIIKNNKNASNYTSKSIK